MLADLPHHDGSPLYTAPGPLVAGETVRLWLRVPAQHRADRVRIRTVPDAEPMLTEARIDTERTVDDTVTWWVADLPLHNPVTNYRFLLDGGAAGTRGSPPRACTIGTSPTPTTSGSRPTSRRRAGSTAPSAIRSSSTDSPPPVRRGSARVGHPRNLGHAGRPGQLDQHETALRRRPRRDREAPRPSRTVGCRPRLPDAVLPVGVRTPLRRDDVRARRPAPRRR